MEAVWRKQMEGNEIGRRFQMGWGGSSSLGKGFAKRKRR
jgi:hypothetical protein